MSAVVFNTLEQAENLQQYGFNEQEAKGLVQVILLSHANLASKDDFRSLEKDMRSLEKDVNTLERDVKVMGETIKSVESHFKVFEKEIYFSLAALDKKILTMTISLGTVVVLALGIYTALLQWLAH